MEIDYKYKFKAVYEDGSVIEQGASDSSETTPGKSRFFDVLEKEKDSKLLTFELVSPETTIKTSLVDGHFEINGVQFLQHRPDLNPYKDFRIIYYRTVKRTVTMGGNELEARVAAYTIGWQVTDVDKNGREHNVQKTVTVN